MPHTTSGTFVFQRPDWMPSQEETANGNRIVDHVGVHETHGDTEYWKVIQRIDAGNEYRVRTSVWSFDSDDERRHRDSRSDLNVPVHIWNQLLHNAQQRGIFEA